MVESVPVRVGGTEFLAEIVDAGGPQVVGLHEAFSFDDVRDTIAAVTEQLSRAWEKVQPSEASVEFGISLSTKTGKLCGLLVEGGGEATLKVTVNWKRPSNG